MRKEGLCKKKLISKSPFGDGYELEYNVKDFRRIDEFINQNRGRKVVVIQGLGFVGSAMLTAVARAKNKKRLPLYAVIGVDLAKPSSYWKIGMINDGKLPVKCSDISLYRSFKKSFKSGNIMATADAYAYSIADIVLVSINLDVKKGNNVLRKGKKVFTDRFNLALRGMAKYIKPSCLIIVESTLPPGTCEKVLLPRIKTEFRKRGYKSSEIKLAYSYERVMPGENYLKSVISYYRIFSAINDKSKKEARKFLESIIDTNSYPLTELSDVTAAEIGKVLENSYRATNIAFIQEWTRLAELAGVNLFEVIDGIRKRHTHRNIMFPGFGVGGYCLTKDPILAEWGNKEIFNSNDRLNMTVGAVEINDKMPLHSFALLRKYLKKLNKRKILIMGVSYLNDIADTRFSPSKFFYKICKKRGSYVMFHDPIVTYWPELGVDVNNDLERVRVEKVDAIVLAVRHSEYIHMTVRHFAKLLKPGGFILDANNIIDDRKADSLRAMGFKLIGVGKGHWNKMLKG